MTRVDAHHHVWDLAVRDQDWIDPVAMAAIHRDFTLADLRPAAVRAGVTTTVIVQTVAVAEETPELLALAAADGLAGGVVGWADLTDPAVADRLAELRALPGGGSLAGIRHPVQAEPDPDWLTRPEVLRGLRAVAAAGLAFDLLTLPHQLPAAVRAVRAVPELRFVLDHLSKPPIARGELRPWHEHLVALAGCGNVAAKLSGLVTEADWGAWSVADLRPYAEAALAAFGPGRLMFGSDWPVCTLAASYADVVAAAEELTAGLSGTERRAVFGDTARHWYRLPSRAAGDAR
ncbi:amidohydrolase family protein [Actinomadura scrupuli]|uniref:amidohydrolase family protein n=1 Tax=Actinomadura scrupuli TaxID=559629 RepID=UPI003D97ACAE